MAAEPARALDEENGAPSHEAAHPPSDLAPPPDAPWRTGLGIAAGVVCGVALAGAFVALDPARTVTTAALETALPGIATACVTALACTVSGNALLRRWSRDLGTGPAGWAYAAGLGLAVLGALAAVPAALGVALSLPVAWALILAVLLGGALAGGFRDVRAPRLSAATVVVGVVALFPGFIEALAPPTDTDEIYYHLDLAREIATRGGLPGGWLTPNGSRPLPVHLVHAVLFGAGGETAPRLLALLTLGAVALAARELGDARFGRGGSLPALALLGSFSFVREAGMAYSEPFVALGLLLAAEALLRGHFRAMGLAAGLALAAKYTAAPVVAGLFLAASLEDRETLRGRLRALVVPALLAVAPTVPWLARNVLSDLHPLFPFAGWPAPASGAPLVFAWPEKYGMGRSVLDFVRLPLDLLFRAETGSFVYLGRINLAWGVLVPAAVFASFRSDSRHDARRLLVVVLLGFAGWAAGAQLLRWLVPLSGVAALFAAAAANAAPGGAVTRGLRIAAGMALAASLPANLAPAWERAAARIDVARGAETRDAFLARELPAWGALAFLRDSVPPDAVVAQLLSWQGYWIPQPHVLGSVEDHVPTRWWLATHGDDALPALAREGVRYLLVGDLDFLPRSYPFLSPTELDAQFRAPARLLRERLLHDATRVHAEGRWEVWRLDPPETTP
jgi:hypothetical protein